MRRSDSDEEARLEALASYAVDEPTLQRDLLDIGPRFGDARRRQILLDRFLLALAGPERQEDDEQAERRHRAHRR